MYAEMPAKPARRAYVVRNSGIHGRGVFATRTIRKGTTIIEYRGERTTWEIARTRPDSDPDNPHHTFIFELNDGSVIDARSPGQRRALDQSLVRSQLRHLRGRAGPRIHRSAADHPRRRRAYL